MLAESSQLKFEIGHVLFIDIVGYSKLLINQQSDQLETLKSIVRGSEQFKKAEAEGKLLRLPTGDGGALVFRTTPEAPVLCAMEIGKELKKHPELQVGTRSCFQRTSNSTAAAEPASPLAGSTDPAPSGYPACAPLRPAWGFPPA